MKAFFSINFLVLILVSACSSLESLPQTAAAVMVTGDTEGDAKGGIYEISQTFPDLEKEIAITAARAGLVHADFEVIKVDKENEVVFGKRVATAFYWDFSAGVYVKDVSDGIWMKLMVDGDANRKKFAQEIFTGIRLFVAAEMQSQPNRQQKD